MTTPVTPIFYLPYPFVLPRSSRPRILTQIVRGVHFLFNFLESEVMKREAGGLGEFLLCPQGKAASPRFMGVIVLGDVC